MPMTPEDILERVQSAIPGAEVVLEDTRGDGDHYAMKVTSPAFEGLSKVQQHQLVYRALDGAMGGTLHALSLTTLPTRSSEAYE